MKHIIEFSQIEFYKKNRFLELAGAIKKERLNALYEAIKKEKKAIETKTYDKKDQFLLCHDFFCKIDDLKRYLTSPFIAQVVSDLTNEEHFRLLFDQLIFYPMHSDYPSSLVINDLSFQGMSIGMLINLGSIPLENAPTFPSEFGNITFFDPTLALDLEAFKAPSGAEFLLVGIGRQETRYRFRQEDPHTHTLKNLGYAFGDHLTNDSHPAFFKKP